MLGRYTYVHDEDPRCVEFFDNPLGRNTNGRDEKSGLLLYTQNEVIPVVSEQ